MLTRKDLNELAGEISRIEDAYVRAHAFWAVASAAGRVNPNFDRDRFRKACDLEYLETTK